MLTVLTPPAATPVSVAELAAHLRLASGFADADPSDDPALDQSLAAAADHVERRSGLALIERRVRWRVQTWPLCSRRVRLPLGPLRGIEAIATVDAGGVETPWAAEAWYPSPTGTPDVYSHAFGSWPAIPPGGAGQIVYDAGYGAAGADVPASLRQAVLLLAAHYFEHPSAADDSAEALPYGVSALLAPFATPRI